MDRCCRDRELHFSSADRMVDRSAATATKLAKAGALAFRCDRLICALGPNFVSFRLAEAAFHIPQVDSSFRNPMISSSRMDQVGRLATMVVYPDESPLTG
jgi:hypothetical protein